MHMFNVSTLSQMILPSDPGKMEAGGSSEECAPAVDTMSCVAAKPVLGVSDQV